MRSLAQSKALVLMSVLIVMLGWLPQDGALVVMPVATVTPLLC